MPRKMNITRVFCKIEVIEGLFSVYMPELLRKLNVQFI